MPAGHKTRRLLHRHRHNVCLRGDAKALTDPCRDMLRRGVLARERLHLAQICVLQWLQKLRQTVLKIVKVDNEAAVVDPAIVAGDGDLDPPVMAVQGLQGAIRQPQLVQGVETPFDSDVESHGGR